MRTSFSKIVTTTALAATATIFLVSCSNPLGPSSNVDAAYQPGKQGGSSTPTPTPAPTPFPSPTVSSVSRSAIQSTETSPLQIIGTGFRAGVQFSIGATPCTTSTFVSETIGTCLPPAGLSIGVVSVTAANTDLQTDTLSSAVTVIGSPKLWVRADSVTNLSDGDSVATLGDSSSYANDFAQPNVSFQPTWIAASANGKPAFRFNGSQSMTSVSNVGITGAAPRSTFFVIKQSSASNRNFFAWGVNGYNQIMDHMLYNGIFMVHLYNGDTSPIAPAFSPGAWTLLEAVYNGTQFQTFANGANPNGPLTIPTFTVDSPAVLGAGIYSAYNSFNGDIAEGIVLPHNVTATERQAIECYLSNKYSLALPSCI